ncbi:MAG: tetratricopeptide repeat protein [Rikenellaceae bacterium]
MRRKYFPLVITLLAAVSSVAPCEASQIQSQYNRSRELFEMGRWMDARQEIHDLRGVESGVELSRIELRDVEYIRAMAALELKADRADLMLIDFSNQHPASPHTTNMLLKEGMSRLESGQMDEAYELLSQINAKKLTRAEAEEYHIRMGYLLMMDGEYTAALHHFVQITKSSRYFSHAAYYSAYVAYVEREYKVAKGRFEELLSDDLYGEFAPYYLMQIEFQLEHYQNAIDYGVKLLEVSDEQSQTDISRLLAEAYFRMGENKQAIAYIDEFSNSGGKLSRNENYIKGFSLHELGKYKQAIEPLRSACGADDMMTQNASFHLANCYLHTGDKSGALKAFAISSNDEFNKQIAEESLFNYAKLQYELNEGHFNETINVLSRYIATYSDTKRLAIAQTLLVAAYYNSRDYESAYENISSIKRPDAEILAAKQRITYLRGLEQFKLKNYDAATKYLKESIEIGVSVKDLSLAIFWLGEIDYLRGDYDGAIKNYNNYMARAPQSIPTTVMSNYSIAYALLKKGNDNSALNYFNSYTSAVQHTEKRLLSDSFSRKGDIYYSKRDFTNATFNYKRAVEEGVGGSGNYALYQIAMIEGIQGRTTAKIAMLKELSESRSVLYVDKAHYEMGRSYIGIGAYQSAVTTLLEFVKRYPRSELYAQALSDLGVAYINMEDSKSALSYYDKAIKAAPQSQIAKDAMLGIREIYVGQGNAQGYFDYAKSIGMEGDLNAVARDSLSFASARGLYLSEDESITRWTAASALDEYIKNYPNGYYLSDALYYLSDCYIKVERNDKAIATLTSLSERGQSQYSERVYGMLSRLCYEEELYLRSAEASRKLYDVTQDQQKRNEAMVLYVDATVMSGDQAAITKMSDEVIALGESKVGAEALLEAKYARATQLRERGERDAALAIYEELALRAESNHVSESSYYVIDDAFRRGLRDETKELIFRFADTPDVDSYWLAKSFILLGDIYMLEDDTFQARATYQSIVDGYSISNDGVIDEAKEKISNLK